MIHSFSAADPTDPRTIAGRWLANGAFVYFGAMNEPFLQAFRPPRLVAALIAEGVPLGAAMPRNLRPSRSASPGGWSTWAIRSIASSRRRRRRPARAMGARRGLARLRRIPPARPPRRRTMSG